MVSLFALEYRYKRVEQKGLKMDKLKSLEDVNASSLPAKMLILLSKYAKALRQTNGTVIKLSSLRVFMHVHQTCVAAQNEELNHYYREMLKEINLHIQAGTMFTNEQKNNPSNVSSIEKKQRIINKYASNKNEKITANQITS